LKRLKLKEINGKNYIVGYGCFGNPDYTEYEWLNKPEVITDEYNQPLYYFDGKRPVYLPISYSTEQLEDLRTAWCQEEIRKLYTAEKEFKILRKAMKVGETKEYLEYDAAVEAIIAESKTIDFQIK